ncbi:RDD family protein [Actinomadura verrucosospora]|uniref:RDD domain-containing protein n=1 Tax=Actinomadura verrucosospora TaxID=46165 RepID=A0A7D4A0D7_ACTVE|nr:RDD family protein [Actinomadura verrucosospora]QKG25046.1 hypothetical protein ACTIVE_6697 [Actinomadura verrucosospora]
MDETGARPLSLPHFVEQGASLPEDGRPCRVVAGTRRRIAARLIDYACVPLLAGLPALVAGLPGPAGVLMPAAAVLMIAVWSWLRVARIALYGCTIGQRIAGIRVVRLEDAARPRWRQALTRMLPVWGGNASEGIGPWDDVIAHRRDAFTRCCLHDKAALTVVVMAVPGVTDELRPEQERAHRAVLAALLAAAALTWTITIVIGTA